MTWPNDIESLPTDFTGADSAATRDHAGLHTTSFRLLNSLQSELGTNPRGAAASVRARLDALDATDALKVNAATVGNLLTPNQASGGDILGSVAEWSGTRATSVYSTTSPPPGRNGSQLVTITGTGGYAGMQTVIPSVKIVAGEAYTIAALVRRNSGTTAGFIKAMTSGTSYNPAIAGVSLTTGSWVWVTHTFTATVTETTSITLQINGGYFGASIGDTFNIGPATVHKGAGGDWAMPGVPITNQAVLPVTQTPVPQAKLWAGSSWAPQPVIIGTGSPLNVVTPDFKGQEFIDNAQTLGARKWVATDTTASSWVVSDGDTGWLPVTPKAGTTVAGTLHVRRTPQFMHIKCTDLQLAAGAGVIKFADIPSGFTPSISSLIDLHRSWNGTLAQRVFLSTVDMEWIAEHGSSAWTTVHPTGLNNGMTGSASSFSSAPWPTAAPV